MVLPDDFIADIRYTDIKVEVARQKIPENSRNGRLDEEILVGDEVEGNASLNKVVFDGRMRTGQLPAPERFWKTNIGPYQVELKYSSEIHFKT